jgi:hypothetical protein
LPTAPALNRIGALKHVQEPRKKGRRGFEVLFLSKCKDRSHKPARDFMENA